MLNNSIPLILTEILDQPLFESISASNFRFVLFFCFFRQ